MAGYEAGWGKEAGSMLLLLKMTKRHAFSIGFWQFIANC
jgi:hypothetical protein